MPVRGVGALPITPIRMPTPGLFTNAYDSGLREHFAHKNDARVQAQIDEEAALNNTKWLAGATEVLLDVYDNDNANFGAAVDELYKVGVDKGVIDPDMWDPQMVTRENIEAMHNNALIGIGGQPKTKGGTATIQEYEYLLALTPEGRDVFMSLKRAMPGAQIKEITRSDGSKQAVIWDEKTRTAYDFQGNPVTSGIPGTQGAPGPGPAPAAPDEPTLGISPTPAQQAAETERAKILAKAEIEDEQSFAADVLANQQRIDQIQGTIDNIDEAIGLTGWWSTGTQAQILSGLGASSALELKAKLQPVRAALAFDKLQAIRDGNKSGGGLGAISERELDLLADSLEALDQAQSTPALVEALRGVRTHYQNILRIQKGKQALRTGAEFAATPAQARQFAPGTVFVTPNGDIMRVPNAQ